MISSSCNVCLKSWLQKPVDKCFMLHSDLLFMFAMSVALLSASVSKIFICYMMHESVVFSYNFMWPLTSSARMQYDLAATIHFGLQSGFNEFLLWSLCMSLSLALFFWSWLLSVCLGNASLEEFAIKKKNKKNQQICVPSLSLLCWNL